MGFFGGDLRNKVKGMGLSEHGGIPKSGPFHRENYDEKWDLGGILLSNSTWTRFPQKLVGSREAVLQIFGGYREETWGMSHRDRRAMRMIATWRKEWSQPDA